MMLEHQSIVGTATAQLPELLISDKRIKVRRIRKVRHQMKWNIVLKQEAQSVVNKNTT